MHSAVVKPNIIVILVDDMGYSDVGALGSEIHTPNLDRLASNGVLMTHVYTSARCCPSRASLMTGFYPHDVGMGHMDDTRSEFDAYKGRIPPEVPLLPQLLKTVGYRTLMCGKWHLGAEEKDWPVNRGFDEFYGIPAGGGVYFWPPVGLERPVYHGRDLVDLSLDPDWYSTDAFTDQAIRFIEAAATHPEPFFLYAAYITPHFPLQAFEEDIAKYDGVYAEGHGAVRRARFERQQQLGVLPDGYALSWEDFPAWSEIVDPDHEIRKMAVYAGMIDRLDQNIGRLVDALERQGVLDDSLLLFLSDNGASSESLNRTPEVEIGSRDSFAAYGKAWANVSNTPYRKYKRFTHEGGTLTPLIAHWPAGLNHAGRVTHAPAHIMDVFATCLDVAGVSYSKHFGGSARPALPSRSFLPQLQKETYDHGRTIFLEHEGHQAVRMGRWKLVRSQDQPWELYDLQRDPCEMHNLVDTQPAIAAKLCQAYAAWMHEHAVQQWPLTR